jgi:hypothetical protein
MAEPGRQADFEERPEAGLEPGRTPVQPVQRAGSRRPIALGLGLVLVVGLLAWRPWVGAARAPEGSVDPSSPVAVATFAGGPAGSPAPAPGDSLDPTLFGPPIVGPWTGRVTGEWSIVAFLRPDPISRDPLNLRQQQVAVFIGPHDLGAQPAAICAENGAYRHRSAAVLPTREVRYLGIAFPSAMTVYVDRVSLVDGEIDPLPIELGRISGDLPLLEVGGSPTPGDGRGASPSPGGAGSSAAAGNGSAAGGPVPTPELGLSDPVRMFALRHGGPWPDGVYRFEAYTRDGLPTQLFACIGA